MWLLDQRDSLILLSLSAEISELTVKAAEAKMEWNGNQSK